MRRKVLGNGVREVARSQIIYGFVDHDKENLSFVPSDVKSHFRAFRKGVS